MWCTQPHVYVYRFDWDEEPSVLGTDLGRAVGVSHGLEIPFVFGHWDLGPQGNVIYTDRRPRGLRGVSRRRVPLGVIPSIGDGVEVKTVPDRKIVVDRGVEHG